MKRSLAFAVALAFGGCHSELDLGHNDPDHGGTGNAGSGGAANPPDGGAAGTSDGAAGATGAAGADGTPQPPIKIALGGSTNAASLGDATGFWGLADRGQILAPPADAHDVCGNKPCQPLVLHGTLDGLVEIALGARHGCAVQTALGTVSCWGDDTFGQLARHLATPDPHPTAVDIGLTGVERLTLGRFHSCAYIPGGNAHCWGLGEHGQLGILPELLEDCDVPAELAAQIPGSPTSVRCVPRPRPADAFANAVEIVAGGFGTCAIFADRSAMCVGLNDKGQLGLGPDALGNVTLPTDFPLTVSTIALGEHHGCAVLPSGLARCFGENPMGEVGVGSLVAPDCNGTPCFHTPVPVSDLSGVSSIAVGKNHSCALLDGGAVSCWGSDEFEQLGNSSMEVDSCGSAPCARTPVPTYDLEDARLLRGADTHSCAIRTNEEVVCWGDNSVGQIGYLRLEPSTFPTPIYNLFL